MQANTPTAWTQLSPWLDELLDLDPAQRQARLAAIALEDGTLARSLQQWLAQLNELDEAGFMAAPAQQTTTAGAGIGQVTGAYTLERLLGEGGMGAVWLARRSDGRYQGQVAIKFLQGGQRSPALARRFAREAQVLARLEHPHIARLLDAGLSPGDAQPYLVLEYVQGLPIDQWCDSRKLNLAQRLHLLLDVLDAVAHAHGRLVLHRDLKPSNILVNEDGQVKLLDFGIARLLGGEADAEADLTRQVGTAYTPRWASPEQLDGGELTPASDVFALGLLMHLVFTGLHPLGEDKGTGATRSMAAWRKRLMAPLPLASAQLQALGQPADRARARVLRGDLDTVIAKALKPHPAERYRNAADMADDLRRHLQHQPILARPDSTAYRARRFLRRHWLAVGAAGAVSAALLVGGGVALLQAQQAQAERAKAEGLLEYMLGELRDQLEPLGQLPLLDGVGQRAQAYYAALPLPSLDDAGLVRRSEALHVLARIAQQRSRVDEMARLADQAQRGSALLLQRQPVSPDALKLNARSASLVAWAAELQGRFDTAETHYKQALAWAEQALALQPGNPELRINLADVQGEFAAYYAERGGPQQQPALALFEQEYQALLQLAPQRGKLWQNVASNRSWVADTLYGMGRYEASLSALQQHRQALDKLPGGVASPSAQWDSVAATNRESGVLMALGRLPEAEAVSAVGVAMATQLVTKDPSNVEWARYSAIYLEQHASTLVGLQRRAEALQQLQTAVQRLRVITPQAGDETVPLQMAWLRVLTALARQQPQDAALFEQLRGRLEAELQRPEAAQQRNDSDTRDVGRACMALGLMWARRGQPEAARRTWESGLTALQTDTLRDEPVPTRVELLLALGRRDQARAEAQALRASGWHYGIPEL